MANGTDTWCAEKGTSVKKSTTTGGRTYGRIARQYGYHGDSSSDVRPRTNWRNSEFVETRQLTELVTAAKQELHVRKQYTLENEIVGKTSGVDVEPDDFNQMIKRVAKLKSIAVMTSGIIVDGEDHLIPIQRALNESQAECVCNCDYYCTCHPQCSCYHQCSCNLECTCYQVCSCNTECKCNTACSCNCDYCGCHYKNTKTQNRGTCSTNQTNKCVGHSNTSGTYISSGCAGHSNPPCSGHNTVNIPGEHQAYNVHSCGHKPPAGWA